MTHQFGEHRERAIKFCSDEGCNAIGIGTKTGWRDPTGEEKLTITAFMLEQVCIAEALMRIHGRGPGLAKAKERLGL